MEEDEILRKREYGKKKKEEEKEQKEGEKKIPKG